MKYQKPAEFARTDFESRSYVSVRSDVATRLKHVCADWSPEEFEALVEKITTTTLKFPPPRLQHFD